ncbi:MAG TPA: LCP family protein [Armatimonadota bacterium]|jgi:LCP family protein required for cell wall assembly
MRRPIADDDYHPRVSYGENATPRRRRSCLGCLGRLFLWGFFLAGTAFVVGLLSFILSPPFGNASTARVLLIGLDEPEFKGAPRRSDSIILCASRLDGSGVTLISVPRDSRVVQPGRRRAFKINAAYTMGKEEKLKEVLAEPSILDAQLPYHVIFSSATVRAVVDALGGIDMDVPVNMDYDDNWQNLHIHLKKGPRHLNGEQAVGYLRWRKNNHGHVYSDDFKRTERQRELLGALTKRLRSWEGVRRMPAVYKALKTRVQTNLTPRQLLMLGWSFRQVHSESVPGDTRTIGGASYVLADWAQGRQLWKDAIR